MVLALVMIVFGSIGIFLSLGPDVPGRFRGPLFAIELVTLFAGVLMMGPRTGWYLGLVAAGLNLVCTIVLSILVIDFTRAVPDLTGLVVLPVLPGLFIGVLAVMILLNPAARAS